MHPQPQAPQPIGTTDVGPDELAVLLDAHQLPAVEYAGEGANRSTTNLTPSAISRIDSSRVICEATASQKEDLHSLLVQFAAIFDPDHFDEVLERVKQTSREAQEEANQQSLSGETGLSHFQKTALIDCCNLLLRQLDLPLGTTAFWRFVGSGTGGKPDIELVFRTRASKSDIVLAVVEIKTDRSFRIRDFIDFYRAVRSGRALVKADTKKVMEGEKTYSPVTQLFGEMASRNVAIGLLENHERFMLVVADESAYRVYPLVEREGRSEFDALWKSPLAMLLATSLLALGDRWNHGSGHGSTATMHGQGVALGSRPPGPTGRQPPFSSAPTASTSRHGLRPPGASGSGTTGPSRTNGMGDTVGTGESAGASPENRDVFDTTTGKRPAPPSPPESPETRPPPKRNASPVKPITVVQHQHQPAQRLPTPPPSPDAVSLDLDQLGDLAVRLVPSLTPPEFDDTALDLSTFKNDFRGYFVPASVQSPLPRINLSSTPSHVNQPTAVAVARHRGQGSLWSAYTAECDHLGPVVAKIADMSLFRDEPASASLQYSKAQARSAIIREVFALSGPLRELSSACVPRLYGLFGSLRADLGEVWVALMEDVGRQIEPEFRSDHRIRAQIRNLYRKMHQANVVHGDVEWRHILYRGTADSVRVIDWERCELKSDETPQKEWLARCEAEMIDVDRMLDDQ